MTFPFQRLIPTDLVMVNLLKTNKFLTKYGDNIIVVDITIISKFFIFIFEKKDR